jgi:hypothetical protein
MASHAAGWRSEAQHPLVRTGAPANDTTVVSAALLALLDDLAVLIARLAHEERLDGLASAELPLDADLPASSPEKAPETS